MSNTDYSAGHSAATYCSQVDPLSAFYDLATDFPEYKLSFGLQFSCIIDWVADITPRANHPQARNYPLWQGQGVTAKTAVERAIDLARAGIAEHRDGGGFLSDAQ